MAERNVLKENEVFLVSDDHGDVAAQNVEGHGLYWRDTRYLSGYELEVQGTRPILLSSAGEHSFMNNFQFANGPLLSDEGRPVEPRTISIRRNRFIRDGLRERIGLFNYNLFPVTLAVSIKVASDFRDMFDVRGYTSRPRHGTQELPTVEGSRVRLSYLGLDGVRRLTDVAFHPAPGSVEIIPVAKEGVLQETSQPGISGHGDTHVNYRTSPPSVIARYRFTIPPKQHCSVTVNVLPAMGDERPGESSRPLTLDEQFVLIRDSYRRWDDECTTIDTDSDILNAIVRRSTHDLRLLTHQLSTGLVPTAGIPWFGVPFGRDSLITSIESLMLLPDIAAGSLRFLARYQGSKVDDWRDEEPGKILHEIRFGEIAALGEVPHTPYYGTVDATPLFLIVYSELLRWSADDGFANELWEQAEAALRWIDDYGDRDHDGFVDYASRSSVGIRNQGWKDSTDAIVHRDGAVAKPPIALSEVQGYVYDARLRMASLYRERGDETRALDQEQKARALKQSFREAFRAASDQYFALGLANGGKPVEAVSSNPGHCVWSGLLDGDDGLEVARRLLSEDMTSGWGVRTLSSREPHFNPMSYHNGSVWPHDNAIIAAGLKRLGLDREAATLISDVLEAAMRFPAYRLPELYCGFARDRRYFSIPAQYPVSCSPQAWSAASVFLMLQTLLGLRVDARARRLWLRPELPDWLGRVGIRGLRVGQSRADFEIVRQNGRLHVEVIKSGGLEVVVEPPTPSSSRR